MTAEPDALRLVPEFHEYRRSQIANLRPYIEGETLSDRVSISAADKEAGSPKAGDMIARNPANHDDQWLVAADYFATNFEPATPAVQPAAGRDRSDAIVLLVRAKEALQAHIDAIQQAKREGGSSAPITDCINDLPEIVRWLDASQLEIEAAFEEYEETAAPAVQPAAGEAEYARAVMDTVPTIKGGWDTAYKIAKRVAALAHPPAQGSESGGEVERLRVLLDNLVIAQTLSREIRQNATDEARSYLYQLRQAALSPQPGPASEGDGE